MSEHLFALVDDAFVEPAGGQVLDHRLDVGISPAAQIVDVAVFLRQVHEIDIRNQLYGLVENTLIPSAFALRVAIEETGREGFGELLAQPDPLHDDLTALGRVAEVDG